MANGDLFVLAPMEVYLQSQHLELLVKRLELLTILCKIKTQKLRPGESREGEGRKKKAKLRPRSVKSDSTDHDVLSNSSALLITM